MLGKVDFPTLGWQVVDWMERLLVHGPGDVAGEPLRLDDDIVRFILWCYRLQPDTGRRVYTRAVRSRPKGSAKSEHAGAIVCNEAVGPCRFSHWAAKGETSWWGYAYERGEPVGVPVRDPFIRCMATEEDQSGNTYDNVQAMMGHLVEYYGDEAWHHGIDVGATRVLLAGSGEIRPSTASNAAKDGGKETFCVSDETHLYEKVELRGMHQTVARNLTKRKIAQPWGLETTTAWAPGMRSVAELSFEYYQQVLAGKVDDPTLLYDHRQAPESLEVFNAKGEPRKRDIVRGIKAAYGDASPWIDVERVMAEEFLLIGVDPLKTEAAARRYFWNQPWEGSSKLVNMRQLDAKRDESHEIVDGAQVVIGFDGSKTRDSTAFIGFEIDENRQPLHMFAVQGWERPPGAPSNWEVDRGEVRRCFDQIADRWWVRALICDPSGWRSQIEDWRDEFGDLKEDGIVMVMEPSVNVKQMGGAIDLFLEGLKNGPDDEHWTWSGAPRHPVGEPCDPEMLRRHLSNAVRAERRGYSAMVKEKETLKIDAGVAAIMARFACLFVPEAARSPVPFVEFV